MIKANEKQKELLKQAKEQKAEQTKSEAEVATKGASPSAVSKMIAMIADLKDKPSGSIQAGQAAAMQTKFKRVALNIVRVLQMAKKSAAVRKLSSSLEGLDCENSKKRKCVPSSK